MSPTVTDGRPTPFPGEYGSGVVSVQGAGARLCYVGDCLIILSFVVTDYPVEPR